MTADRFRYAVMRKRIATVALLVAGCAASGETELREQLDHQQAEREDEQRRTREDARSEVQALIRAREQKATREQATRERRSLSKPSASPSPSLVSPTDSWLNDSELRCALEMNHLACSESGHSAEDVAACHRRCLSTIKEAAERLIKTAIDNCVNLYTAEVAPAAPGPECALTFPAAADPKGTGEGLAEQLRAQLRTECTAACRKDGTDLLVDAKERDKVAQQGQGLVLAYKRCMLAVDGTREALRYKIHDADLYQDLMQKTDTRCRAASRCDWIEKHSDEFSCSYGN